MCPVQLATFDNSFYTLKGSFVRRAIWYFAGLPLLRLPLIPSSGVRRILLRAFGASVGKRVVIRPGTRVKYPWLLQIGDDTWIGEDCWIDNLAPVRIGSNVCISQGAYLCTGSHDWTDTHFGLIVRPITLEDGVWVGAKTILSPGTWVGECAVLAAGSVAKKRIEPYSIYAGNPAVYVRRRDLPPHIVDSFDGLPGGK